MKKFNKEIEEQKEKNGERVPIQVSVYCFRKVENNILFLLLNRTPEYGRFWQGITGAPFQSEDLLDAAKRELHEETNLIADWIKEMSYRYSFPMRPEWDKFYRSDVVEIWEHVFLAHIIDVDRIIVSKEHDEMKWVSLEVGLNMLKWDGNKEALKSCYKYLNPTSEN
ncbi:MAG: NUDIX pyrophosphatase [Oligoflexia bacterium]|nr:NUDIX pyrophosphatase [Oligoflexia bacterium]